MNKLLIICGPTATGKTSLGIKLAKKLDGEIVSADSRQVYMGMDLITGKDINKQISKFQISKSISSAESADQIGYYEKDGGRIWLYDIVEPSYKFNVADYKECADEVMADIRSRGKLPIIVGGTGFYIKAVTEGIETLGVEPDWELREKLQSNKAPELQRILEETCPERMRGMNESDRKNPRRLIRAIEIARNVKGSAKGGSKVKSKGQMSKVDKFYIGLTAPYETLYQRIDRRVEERIKMGAEEEVKKLLGKGYNWENSALGTTIGYREWRDYFEKKSTQEEIVQKWKFAEHNYSRRQMTWFRKALQSFQGKWFDITGDYWETEVEKLVQSWYS